MSSDGFFDDDFDVAVFDELDAIEAAHFSPTRQALPARPISSGASDSSFGDLSLEIGDEDFAMLDQFVEDNYNGTAQPVVRPPMRTSSRGSLQTTLFGDVLPNEPSGSKPRAPQMQRTKSTPRNPFGQQAPKTKRWDHTAFAKSGIKQSKAKGKGKAKASNDDDDDDDEEGEAFVFEQFPAPFVPVGPPPPMKFSADPLEAKHWIYPLNQPKRDYQYNIVKNCLFENTIVSLPTGLGKTFVAGVVMLNFYRWFPEGKVVFVAPTKPLVAQQIDACHRTCGIPGIDAAELTGQNNKATRHRAWQEKRVFYMTPQTLVNDLVSGTCDVRDIVLLVIDEAHRATGDYAYNQVVRFMMAKNPHFRLLALTATPGGKTEAVQNLIDGLHISRIEIRDENSLDLKDYIHLKTIEQHVIKMSDDVNKVKDLLVKLMESVAKPVRMLLPNVDFVKMHPYRATGVMQTLKPDQRYAYKPLSKLSALARIMGYLVGGTMSSCYTALARLRDEDDDPTGKKKTSGWRSNPLFQAVMAELERQRSQGLSVHPKMELLKTLIVQHFGARLDDDGQEGTNHTKVMVFAENREVVDDIVEALEFEKPLIRPSKFIGQGVDKQGKKGFAQKEQLEVIKKFKADEFNVLVATSIGEEGLDIGEVDLIVCYDAQKTPIRMLQRVGRTGRKRAGVVHVLLSEGREEGNLDTAKQTYKDVQKTILRGDQLELYADVERLLPDQFKPICLEKQMEIQEYVREDGRKRTTAKERSASTGTKRKRNDDVERNMPPGASTGFVKVSDLLVKTAKKPKKVKEPKNFEHAGEDDDEDLDLESGAVAALPRRSVSTSAANKSAKGKGKLRKAATMDPAGQTKKKKTTKRPKAADPTSSQFSTKGVDDDEDMDIEQGSILPDPVSPLAPPPNKRPRVSPPPGRSIGDAAFSDDVIELDSDTADVGIESTPNKHSGVSRSPRPDTSFDDAFNEDVLELDSDTLAELGVDYHPSSDESPQPQGGDGDESMAWLIDEDEDENPDFDIVDSSPILQRKRSPRRPTVDEAVEYVKPLSESPTKSPKKPTKRHRSPLAELYEADASVQIISPPSRQRDREGFARPRYTQRDVDESVEFVEGSSYLPPSPIAQRASAKPIPNQTTVASSPMIDDSIEFVDEPYWRSPAAPAQSPAHNVSLNPALSTKDHKTQMLPPPLPSRLMDNSHDPMSPEASFPVRPMRGGGGRIHFEEPESPTMDMPPPSFPVRPIKGGGRLHLAEPESPTMDMPPPSFPVRPIRRGPMKAPRFLEEPESPTMDMPPPSQRRLRRQDDSPPPAFENGGHDRDRKGKGKGKGREKLGAMRHNPLFDMAADHSGDEVSEGSSQSEDDEMSESDRIFLEELPETQMSASYDQSMAYRQGLLTQAPGGPAFGNRPVRRGPFGRNSDHLGSKRRPGVSSSPPREGDSEVDEYMLGSFVVDDDEEISYEVGNSSEM